MFQFIPGATSTCGNNYYTKSLDLQNLRIEQKLKKKKKKKKEDPVSQINPFMHNVVKSPNIL